MNLISIETKDFTAQIAPEKGGNLCNLTAFGHKIIDYDSDLLDNCIYTGMPILYPTPNRVVNGEFIWRDNKLRLKKGKKLYDCHGLVYDEVWQCEKLNESTVKVWLDFIRGTDIYKAFPYKHRITLIYSLDSLGLNIKYQIENYGDKQIPFGFGIHPYFQKLCDDIDVFINAKNIMKSSEQYLIPTGELEVYTPNIMKLSNIYKELVYININPSKCFNINYKQLGIEVESIVSDDFNFVVLFNPIDQNYFCIENQTSSVNGHNLYNKGYINESGIILINGHQTKTGFIKFLVKIKPQITIP